MNISLQLPPVPRFAPDTMEKRNVASADRHNFGNNQEILGNLASLHSVSSVSHQQTARQYHNRPQHPLLQSHQSIPPANYAQQLQQPNHNPQQHAAVSSIPKNNVDNQSYLSGQTGEYAQLYAQQHNIQQPQQHQQHRTTQQATNHVSSPQTSQSQNQQMSQPQHQNQGTQQYGPAYPQDSANSINHASMTQTTSSVTRTTTPVRLHRDRNLFEPRR